MEKGNRNVTNEQILLIQSQHDAIDEQIRVLRKSKANILKSFWISRQTLHSRITRLKKLQNGNIWKN